MEIIEAILLLLLGMLAGYQITIRIYLNKLDELKQELNSESMQRQREIEKIRLDAIIRNREAAEMRNLFSINRN